MTTRRSAFCFLTASWLFLWGSALAAEDVSPPRLEHDTDGRLLTHPFPIRSGQTLHVAVPCASELTVQNPSTGPVVGCSGLWRVYPLSPVAHADSGVPGAFIGIGFDANLAKPALGALIEKFK